MSKPIGSLREHYSEPRTTWSFVPLSDTKNGSSSPKAPTTTAPSNSSGYQWTSRPRPNSIYELSPDLEFEPSAPNTMALLRAAAASVVLQYFSAALENPWEVGKTLLQIQYVPRDTVAAEDLEPNEEDEETSDDASSANEDNYFADEAISPSRVNTPRPIDDRGYIIRQSLSDSATRPDWVIPPGTVSGVWGMMKQVKRWKPEGWLALWKGTATFCARSFLDSSLQPLIHSSLTHLLSNVTLSPSPAAFAATHPLLLSVASSVLTGFLLSPLDLIRTRLIAQTSHPKYRTYTSPLDALNKILMYEGGIRGIYLHPQLLYPTILETGLNPLLSSLGPRIIARLFRNLTGIQLGSSASISYPFLTTLAHLIGSCLSLLVTVPVEVIRKRLQIQYRQTPAYASITDPPPSPGMMATCVEVRRRPYAGIVDAFYSIVVEERSDLPLRGIRRKGKARRMTRVHDGTAKGKGKGKGKAKEGEELVEEDEKTEEEDSLWRNTGLAQLYRGIWMRVGATILSSQTSWLSAVATDENGWTEL